MVEAPRIRILYDNIKNFKNKTILEASGSSYKKFNIDLTNFIIKKWWFCGKYIFAQVQLKKIKFVIRTHMLMYGSIHIVNTDINTVIRNPFLKLVIDNGVQLIWIYSQINILDPNNHNDQIKSNYAVLSSYQTIINSIQMRTYDISHPKFNFKLMVERLNKYVNDYVNDYQLISLVDFLLDQFLFPGVGNILQQEALYACKLNPVTLVSNIDADTVSLLVKNLHRIISSIMTSYLKGEKYSLSIYHKKYCPLGHKTITKYLGMKNRRTTWCPQCQQY